MAINKLFDLKGRTALVTGSSRGIGRAIGLGLAEQGADVCFHYVGNRAGAEEAVNEARDMGVKAGIVGGDMAEAAVPGAVFAAAVEQLGRVDILVSNVAIQYRRAWRDITHEEFDRQMIVNFRSGFDLIQLALPGMIERGWGRIVTVGSVQQNKPNPAMVVYAASKAAQLSAVRNLAKQVAPHGVTINNLAPGVIATDRSTEPLADPEYRKEVLSWIPSGFVGEAEDCVGTALLLCSDAGRYITGADFSVDGGMSLR